MSPYGGGGGGGAGAAGDNFNAGPDSGGPGGDGLQITWDETTPLSGYYAGGGSGAYVGTGGQGGGANTGSNATANTGGGGAGGSYPNSPPHTAGGSGIVIISYPTS